MSNLWVPGGQQPRPKGSGNPIPRPPVPGGMPPGGRPGPKGPDAHAGHDDDDRPSPQEVQQATEAYMAQVANAPAVSVITNHVVQLFELARIYLSQEPPKLVDAALSIDAMNALVEGLEGLLGENEDQMRAAVGGLRMFYLQIRAAYPEEEAPPEPNGGPEPTADEAATS